MREEVKNWLRQAEADLKSAMNCIKPGDYYLSVFACQQSLEKSLKALCLLKMYEFWKYYPLDIAPLCYTPEEFNKLKKQIGIVREAVKQGIEI